MKKKKKQNVAIMAQAASASPPQAPLGPTTLQKVTKEAAAKIKIRMEKMGQLQKGLGF